MPVSAVPGARQGAPARPVASLAARNLLRSEALELLLDADPVSYRSAHPRWRPTLGDGTFNIVDMPAA
jgi:hypothetical protein